MFNTGCEINELRKVQEEKWWWGRERYESVSGQNRGIVAQNLIQNNEEEVGENRISAGEEETARS